MARRKAFEENYKECPATLEQHPFYGLTLDNEQKIFRDAIWSPDNDIVFCDAMAGCGKTLITVATANLLVQYGRYDGIVYIVSPVQEQKLGFLPGTPEEKIGIYGAPLYDALEKLGINAYSAVNQASAVNQKTGTGYIDCISHVYLRGCNLENKVVILEECQNYYGDELKKTLTRVCDSSKTICIGHRGQCDLYHAPDKSGFVPYLEHFAEHDRCAVCQLTENHRGWVSQWADKLDI